MQLEPDTPPDLKEAGGFLAVSTFTPYFQNLCHGLINSKCITGVIRNGELCIHYSEIISFTVPGYDLPLP